MTEALTLAHRHAVRQRRIASTAVAAALREWDVLDAHDLRASWSWVGPRLVAVLTAGQMAAAEGADDYVEAAAAAQGAEADPGAATVRAAGFAGVAADGRPLDTLMLRSLITTFESLGRGASTGEALRAGRGLVGTIVRSEVADAGRGATGAAMAGRRTIQGYVRVVQPPACARCVILAGREYGWNAGFQRHPRCDCIHLPTTLVARNQIRRGSLSSDRFTPTTRPGGGGRAFINPQAYFNTLSRAEQDRIFTADGAQAIRDGADMASVINARRGMYTADLYRRRLAVTREGTTRRGSFYRSERRRDIARGRVPANIGSRYQLRSPRLLPEEIYRIADDRDEAISMLRRYGYLT